MHESNGRILLVEDHQDTLDMISLFLQMQGYEVITAYTITDGLRLAKDKDFDLYLLDGKLPDGTGIEMCRHIREFDPETPILFCSASAYPFNVEQAKAAGSQAYLTKPVDPDVLMLTISKLLGNEAAMLTSNPDEFQVEQSD